jgi:hypothetical protein
MDREARGQGRKLECDCGYVAHGDDDDDLVAAVQAHARRVHGMELSSELVLTLAGTNGAVVSGTAPGQQPEGTIVSPPTRRRLG